MLLLSYACLNLYFLSKNTKNHLAAHGFCTSEYHKRWSILTCQFHDPTKQTIRKEKKKIRVFFFPSLTLKPYQPLNISRIQKWRKKWPYSPLHKVGFLNIVLFGNWFYSADSFPTLWSHVYIRKVKKQSMKKKQGSFN